MTQPKHSNNQSSLLAQAREWAWQLKSGRVHADELKQFRAWQSQSVEHQQAWLQAVREWHLLHQASLQKAQQYSLSSARPPCRQRRRLLGGFAAAGCTAAAGAMLLSPPWQMWSGWQEWGADFRTVKGEQKNIQLHDELAVLLNTQSSIKVIQQEQKTEVVLLAGEAAFLSRGQACSVISEETTMLLEHGQMDIRREAGNKTRVRCRSGQVQIRHPSGEYVLHAAEQLHFTAQQVHTAQAYDEKSDDWQQGVLRFDQHSLEQVLSEINRYRPGKIILMNRDLAQRSFSGAFHLNDLDDALLLLQQSYQLQARQLGTVLLLS